jgi:hypothetical protein
VVEGVFHRTNGVVLGCPGKSLVAQATPDCCCRA